MRNGLGRVAALIGMASALGGKDIGMPSLRELTRPTVWRRPVIGYYKFEGELPKGCKKEVVTLEFIKNDYKLFIDVDVVYATAKGREKKLVRYRAELSYYIEHTWINDIIETKKFKAEPILP